MLIDLEQVDNQHLLSPTLQVTTCPLIQPFARVIYMDRFSLILGSVYHETYVQRRRSPLSDLSR